MTPDVTQTRIEEKDVALWIGQEIMNKNVMIKNLENQIYKLQEEIKRLNNNGKKS